MREKAKLSATVDGAGDSDASLSAATDEAGDSDDDGTDGTKPSPRITDARLVF